MHACLQNKSEKVQCFRYTNVVYVNLERKGKIKYAELTNKKR